MQAKQVADETAATVLEYVPLTQFQQVLTDVMP
jgi:hypothetical protein